MFILKSTRVLYVISFQFIIIPRILHSPLFRCLYSTQLRFNGRRKRTDSYLMARLNVSGVHREHCTRG